MPTLLRPLAAVLTGCLACAPAAVVHTPAEVFDPRPYGDLQELVVLQTGSVSREQPATISLPIDRTIEKILIHVSYGATGAIALRRPLVKQGLAGVVAAKLPGHDVWIVDRPEPGEWQLRVEGSGKFSAIVAVTSPLTFAEFDFVAFLDDLHGGYFPIQGEPVVGSGEPEPRGEASLFLEASSAGELSSASFALEGEDGQFLGTLSLKQNSPDAPVDHYHGLVPLPSVPFRVVASGNVAPSQGEDTRGTTYRRVFPTLYRARTLAVDAVGTLGADAAPGQTLTLEFLARNRGAAEEFSFSALDELGFVKDVSPPTAVIPQDGSATVRVSVSVGPAAEPSSLDEVRLIARKAESGELANTCTRWIEIVRARALR